MKTILKYFALTVLGLLAVAIAYAQTALDIQQGGAYPLYPAYLDHSCGGVKLTQTSDDLTAYVRVSTVCPGSGRGSKTKLYAACWEVTFAEDRYSIVSREVVACQ